MKHFTKDQWSALPIEIRNNDDDPLAEATRAVEELRSSVTEFRNNTDSRLAALDDLTGRLDELEMRSQRPGDQGGNTDAALEVETRAINHYIRGGIGALDDEERRALNLTTPSAGGYAVAPEYSTRILEGLTQFSPIRSVASVLAIGTTEVKIPTLASVVSGTWVTETSERQSSQPVLGQVSISTYEHAVIVPVSTQLLEDSFVDLAAFLAGHIGAQFGKAEASAFVNGNGDGKPTGLLNSPESYVQVDALQNGSDIIAAVIAAHYALPGVYAARASWLMNRKTQGIIRAAADNTTKGTLWSDSLANGTPPMLLGRPVLDCPDMDDLDQGGGSPTIESFPIAFGDIASSYQIVDRIGIQIMRDDFTGADTGITKIRARRRVGGKPTLTESMVLVNGI